MFPAETPRSEPKEGKPAARKMGKPGKLDGHRPVETAVVRDPDPNPAPPGNR